MTRAAQQTLEFACFNFRGAVVAALHGLQRLCSGELEAVLSETGIAQHVDEKRQAGIHIFSQAVERCIAFERANTGGDIRRQECRFVIECFGGLRLCAAGANLRSRQARDTFLALRVQIFARAHDHGDIDQREFVVLHQKSHGAAGELVAEVGRDN